MLSLLLCVGCTLTAWAADLQVKTPKYAVSVEFFTPSIVRITKQPADAQALRPSMVVTLKPQNVQLKRKGNTLESIVLGVSVDARTGNVTFSSRKDGVMLREQSASFQMRTEGPDKGAYRAAQTFTLRPDEAIYGLGTVQDGKLNRRGLDKEMEQSNLEDFMNVVQSIRGWSLYWDNYSRTRFTDNAQGMTLSSEVADAVDYYFMLGGCADGNVALMRELSGDVPMLPLWTYGFWQSKERYKSVREVLDVVDKHRQQEIPLDGIIQDWQYWGSNYTWNAMDFLAEDYADGNRMIQETHRRNAHMMISIWASFGPHTLQFKELSEKGMLYDFSTWPQSGLTFWPPRMEFPSGVRVYDALNPEARDIYWKYLRKLFDAGMDAWWMDSTDPDFFDAKESDFDHPAGDGTWRRYRNAFPLASVSGVHDNQRQTSQDKRVFIMTRSSFAGQQRYGSNMWTGDVTSSWDMLRKQVPAGLNYVLTGNPNFNTDIGGFFCGAYNTQGGGSAPRNPQFQELYVRWMQYALFHPVFRSHGADAPREIWQFGTKGEPVYDAIASSIRFRYQLLPLLYSQAWQVTKHRASYFRPLHADFAHDRRTWDMASEYLFGRSLLVAPILEPQYTPEKVTRVDAPDFTRPQQATKYLPQGALWYDFWTNQRYKGGRDVTFETRFDRLPLFVRAGAILPLAPVTQWAQQSAWDNLELRVYPGAHGTFTLYEDEGDNYNYEQGAYSTIFMTWNDTRQELTLHARQGKGFPGMLRERTFQILWPDGTHRQVNYSGSEIVVKK